jgi:hypothetical protein
MGFSINHDRERQVIEVVYPPSPTPEDVAAYLGEIRQAMEAAAAQGPWCCLVDQRDLKVLDPALVGEIATMNAFARARGMRKSARLVKGAMAELQAGRIARAAELDGRVRTFEDRDQALAWLQQP